MTSHPDSKSPCARGSRVRVLRDLSFNNEKLETHLLKVASD